MRRRSGNVAVEFALVLPVLLLGMVGIMDMGRMIWAQTALGSAVQAAARCGAIDAATCPSTGAIQSFAAAAAIGLSVPAANFGVLNAACGLQVTGTYAYVHVLPYAGLGTDTLTATACYPI